MLKRTQPEEAVCGWQSELQRADACASVRASECFQRGFPASESDGESDVMLKVTGNEHIFHLSVQTYSRSTCELLMAVSLHRSIPASA